MTYDIRFKPRAVKDLEGMTAQVQTRILAKIETMRTGLKGDVKRLTNFTPEFRLRVGEYRVLFEVEEKVIVVYRVCHRGRAYR